MGTDKKILVVTPHFYPEDFKVNDIAFELYGNGFDVTVVTCIPNYPQGRFFKGYSYIKKRKEIVKGVKVYRVFVIPRGNGSGIMLGLNYLSYLISASFVCFFLALRYKFTHVFVHETSPVTVGLPAIIVKKIQKIPLCFWVLDLWPESILAASNFKNKIVLDILERLVTFIYKNCDNILISSNGFRKSIEAKGDFSKKISYFPNWAEDLFVKESLDHNLPQFPDGFKVLFAGNIGEAQNFETIMSAALHLASNSNIHFCIVGDGRKKIWVEEFIKKNNLNQTVHLYGRYPLETMPSFFKKADVMLLSLKDEPIFSLTVPAKLQAYMASGKPVVGAIDGEGALVIDKARCGFSVKPFDSKGLADIILRSSSIDRAELSKLGQNGKGYYHSNFQRDDRIQELINIMST